MADITRVVNDTYPIVGNIYITKVGANSRTLKDLTDYTVQLHLYIKKEKVIIDATNIYTEDVISVGATTNITSGTKIYVKDMPLVGIPDSGTLTVGSEVYGYTFIDSSNNYISLDGLNTVDIPDGSTISIKGSGGKVSFPLTSNQVSSAGKYTYSVKLIKGSEVTTYGGGNLIIESDL